MHEGAAFSADADVDPVFGAALILDVNGMPMDALLDAEDSILNHVVRRVVRGLDAAESYAAHSSST
jgi:FXSXX-COOH protein